MTKKLCLNATQQKIKKLSTKKKKKENKHVICKSIIVISKFKKFHFIYNIILYLLVSF